MNSIKVLGLVTGEHHLDDLNITIPHNVVVEIPIEQALVSKDLWRAISQRLIFKLHGPAERVIAPQTARPAPPPPAPVPAVDDERIRSMERENANLRQQLASQNDKLDAILTALQQRPVVVQQIVSGPPTGTVKQAAVMSDVVDDAPPMFIPSTIKPEITDSKIEIEKSESEGSALSTVGQRLKALREQKKAGGGQ